MCLFKNLKLGNLILSLVTIIIWTVITLNGFMVAFYMTNPISLAFFVIPILLIFLIWEGKNVYQNLKNKQASLSEKLIMVSLFLLFILQSIILLTINITYLTFGLYLFPFMIWTLFILSVVLSILYASKKNKCRKEAHCKV